jgi:hypothetical protein
LLQVNNVYAVFLPRAVNYYIALLAVVKHVKGNAMDIQGSSGVAQTLMVKSVQMANNHMRQEGQAVLELLESAQSVPMPSTSSVGGTINTYA